MSTTATLPAFDLAAVQNASVAATSVKETINEALNITPNGEIADGEMPSQSEIEKQNKVTVPFTFKFDITAPEIAPVSHTGSIPLSARLPLEHGVPHALHVSTTSQQQQYSIHASSVPDTLLVTELPVTAFHSAKAFASVTRVTEGTWNDRQATFIGMELSVDSEERIKAATATITLYRVYPASKEPDIVWVPKNWYGAPSKETQTTSWTVPVTVGTPTNPIINASTGVTYSNVVVVDREKRLSITCRTTPQFGQTVGRSVLVVRAEEDRAKQNGIPLLIPFAMVVCYQPNTTYRLSVEVKVEGTRWFPPWGKDHTVLILGGKTIEEGNAPAIDHKFETRQGEGWNEVAVNFDT